MSKITEKEYQSELWQEIKSSFQQIENQQYDIAEKMFKRLQDTFTITLKNPSLYDRFIDAGCTHETVCDHCGGELQIHGYTTLQCPKDGIDFPLEKILQGEKSEWLDTTFSPVPNPVPYLLSKSFDLGAYADKLVEKIFGEVKNVEI